MGSPAKSRGARASSHPKSLVLQHLRSLQEAWTKYWSDVTRYWRFIKTGVQGAVGLKTLRASYMQAGVHKVVVADDLQRLSAELNDLRHACQSAEDHIPGMEQAMTLCDALLEALRADATIHEQCSRLRCGAVSQNLNSDAPSWASIRQCLLGRRTTHCCTGETSTASTGSPGDASPIPSSPIGVSSPAPEVSDLALSTETAPARSLRSWSFGSYILEGRRVNSHCSDAYAEAVVQILLV